MFQSFADYDVACQIFLFCWSLTRFRFVRDDRSIEKIFRDKRDRCAATFDSLGTSMF
jgi:hypothetical protein